MRTEFVPGKPSPAQADFLADAVYSAYKERGWKGSLRENARPVIPRWTTRPTRLSLRSKGLLEVGPAQRLTKAGVEAGEALFKARRGKSAKEAAEEAHQKREEIERKHRERVDLAKHLFRGLHLYRGATYGRATKANRAVAAHIERSAGGEIRLNLDDLLELGEQIEALR